jgi:molecular chaperone GrpE
MTRIPINVRNQNNGGNGTIEEDSAPTPAENANELDILGNTTGEVAGPGGAGLTGGEITNPQDAEESLRKTMDDNNALREMEQMQQEGEVEVQRHDLKPSPSNPEEGLPENPTGKENTGGANESATDGDTARGDASSTQVDSPGATAGEVSRATMGSTSEANDRFLRAVADLENFKRQSARRETEARERAVRNVVEDLLPVLDNFERALQAAQNSTDVQSLRMGVEFIAQQFRDALKNHGVEPIQAEGQAFDPLRHEALEQISGSDQPEGTIIGEAQRGYSFKGQVIRPSRVRVAGK